MKKVMFLVMVAVMPFISCSSDDVVEAIEDAIENPAEDALIGEWFLIGKKHIIDGAETIIPLTACDKLDKFVINDDGILIYSSYYKNGDDCELEGNEEVSWNPKAFEENTYSFRYMEKADGISSVVKLDGKTITETYSYSSGDSTIEVVNIYSTTPDESGDDEGADQYQIIGKWRESKFTEIYYEDGVLQETVESQPTSVDYFEVEFRADATFTSFRSYSHPGSDGEEIVETNSTSGTYEIKGDTIILTNPAEDGEENENYTEQARFSLAGNVLTFYTSNEETINGVVHKDEFIAEYSRQ